MTLRVLVGWSAITLSGLLVTSVLIFLLRSAGIDFSGPVVDWMYVLGLDDPYAPFPGKSWAFVPLALYLAYRLAVFGRRRTSSRAKVS